MSVLEAKGDAVRASGQWSIAIGQQPLKPRDSKQARDQLAENTQSQQFQAPHYEGIIFSKPAHMFNAVVNSFTSSASALFENCSLGSGAKAKETILVNTKSLGPIEATTAHLVNSTVRKVTCDDAYIVGSQVPDLQCTSMVYTPTKNDFGKDLVIRTRISDTGKIVSLSIKSEPIEKLKQKARYSLICCSSRLKTVAFFTLTAACAVLLRVYSSKNIFN